MLKKIRIALFILVLFCSFSILDAQENETQGMPSAQVVVSEVTAGMVAPESEFIGTVYYQEVSDVASEVDGVVEVVNFEEGQRVKEGEILVKVNSDLLEKTIQAAEASHEQALSELEKSERELKRAERLYKENLISEQAYDERRFDVNGLEKRAFSLKSEVERFEVELQKKSIKAPFDGVVVNKYVDRGEWLSPGAPVATIARDDMLDIIVEVPGEVIKAVRKGMVVRVNSGGRNMKGEILSIIPRGDVLTRTFPVKIRLKNTFSLVEGMEARVTLPVEKEKKALTVPRDAVATVFGITAVFAVIDSKARMIPVEILGYKGMTAGVYAEGLKRGMQVVVKGNERLRDGQPVVIKSQTPDTK